MKKFVLILSVLAISAACALGQTITLNGDQTGGSMKLSCGDEVYLEDAGNYSGAYRNSGMAAWNYWYSFYCDPGYQIEVTFEASPFQMGPNGGSHYVDVWVDGYVEDDDAERFGPYKGNSRPTRAFRSTLSNTQQGRVTIRYYAPRETKNKYDGFRAKIKVIGCPDLLPERFLACQAVTEFTDGFGNYEPNQSYRKTFSTVQGAHVRVSFVDGSFGLGAGDWLEAYDYVYNPSTDDYDEVLIGRYEGTTMPPVLTSTDRSMFFIFHSDDVGEDRGWIANVSSVGCYLKWPDIQVNCLTTTDFTDGVSNYPNNQSYYQTFVSQPGARIQIGFSEFAMTDADHLDIYDGSDMNSTLVGSYTGSTLPPTFTSTSNALTVAIYTNESGNALGWNATVSAVDCMAALPGEAIPCGSTVDFTSAEGKTLDQEFYTKTYSSTEPLTIHFSSFSIEADDHLYIYDGADATSTPVAVYAAGDSPSDFTSTGLSLTIKFDNNLTGTDAEWAATVTSAACSGGSFNFVPQAGSVTYGPEICGQKIYDNGGPDRQYSNNCGSTGGAIDYSTGYAVIDLGSSNENKVVRISGKYTFDWQHDYLTIFDGVGTEGTVLWGGGHHGHGHSPAYEPDIAACNLGLNTNIDGGYQLHPDRTQPEDVLPSLISIDINVVSKSNAITIHFYSDGATTGDGFEFDVTCEDKLTDCYSTGTVIFREDFGGNSVDDPVSDANPLGTFTVSGTSYNLCDYNPSAAGTPCQSGSEGRYAKQKYGSPCWKLFVPLDDHTYPGNVDKGYFLQFDASNATNYFYRQKIHVPNCNGVKLVFSFWIANINGSGSSSTAKPNLIFELHDSPNFTDANRIAYHNSGDIAPVGKFAYSNCVWNVNDWTKVQFEYEMAPGVEDVFFGIKNNCSGTNGNDFAIDDIEVRVCVPSVDLHIYGDDEIFSSLNVCTGQVVTLEGELDSEHADVYGTDPVYAWQRSDDNVNWELITFDGGETADGLITTNSDSQYGGTQITITEPDPTPGNPVQPHHYYRLIVAGNEGNIESEFCRSISNIFDMKVTPIPQIVFDGDNFACEGGELVLSLTDESPREDMGSWSIAGVCYNDVWIDDLSTLPANQRPTLNSPTASQPHYTVTGALPDFISIMFMTTPQYGGCWNKKTIPIYSLPEITITPDDGTLICSGTSVDLVATSDLPVYSYEWDDGSHESQRTVSPTAVSSFIVATYTVTVTTRHAIVEHPDPTNPAHYTECSDQHSTTINVAPLPTITSITAPTDSICPGTSVTLSVVAESHSGGTIQYSWEDESNYSASGGSHTVSPDVTHTYTVYIKDVHPDGTSSCTIQQDVEVLVHKPPVLHVGAVPEIDCYGANTGQIPTWVTGGSPLGTPGAYYYEFSLDNVHFDHPTEGDMTRLTFSPLTAGSYTVYIRDKYCSDSEDVVISQPDVPFVAEIYYPIIETCEGQSVGRASVEVSGGAPFGTAPDTYYQYQWSTTPVQTTATAIGLAEQVYYVTVTDSKGCKATTFVDVTARPVPTYTIAGNDLTKCLSTPSATFTVTPDDSNPADAEVTDYSWEINTDITSSALLSHAGLPSTHSGSTLNSITVTPDAVGTYGYTVTLTAQDGCQVSSDFTLAISEPPTIALTSSSGTESQTKCYGDFPAGFNNIIFTFGGGATGVNFEWTSTPAPTCLSYDAGTMTISATGTAPTEGASYSYRAVTTTAAGNTCPQETIEGTITIRPQLSVSVTADHTACGHDDIGEATATPTGGSGSGYSYRWNTVATPHWENDSTRQSIVKLPGGSYRVTVTDGNSCTAINTVDIESKTNPTISIAKQDVLCKDGESGSITVTVTNPGTTASTSNPYTDGPTAQPNYYVFSKDDGETTYNSSGAHYEQYPFTGLSTQGNETSYTYNIYVRDGNDCTARQNVEITQPSLLTATIDNSTSDVIPTCQDQSVGAATVRPGGGTQSVSPAPAYTYAWNTYPTATWDPVRTTQTINGLPEGSYRVTVTDAHFCTATATVAITPLPVPDINASTTAAAVCLSSSSSTFSILNSNNPPIASHSWSVEPTDGAGLPANLATASLTVEPSGTSTTAPTTYVYLTVNPTVVLTHTSGDLNQTLCFEKTLVPIVFEYSGGASEVTLTWEDPAPASTCLSYAINSTAQTLTISEGDEPVAGTYRYRVDAVGAVSPCTNPYYEGIIIIRPKLTVTVTGDHQSCVTGNIGVVTAHPAGGKPFGTAPDTYYQYSWNTTPTPRITQSINELAGGTYKVTVTDDNTCTATASVTIESKTNPSISIDVTNVLCHGFNTGAIQVTVTNHGTAAGTSNPYGEGTTTEPYFYLFSKDGGSNTEQSSGDDYYVHSFPNLLANTYNIYVRDGNDCVATATPQVTEPDTYVTAEITDANTIPTCQGQSVGALTVTADHGTHGTSPNPEYTYSWNTGATTASINELSAGMYTVVVTDGNGCSITTSKEVLPRPVPDFSLDVTGRADKCLYDNETELVVSNGGTGSTYAWSASSTDAGLPAGSDDATVTVTPAVGTHTYTVSITASNGCVVTASVPLTIYPVPTVALSGTVTEATCNGYDDGGFSLVATGGTIYDNGTNPSTPYYYQFSIDGGSNYTPYYSNSNTSVTAQFTDLLAQTYNVVVSDSHECTASVSGGVEVWQPTLVTATPSVVTEDCAGQAIGVATVTPNGGRIGVAPYPEYRYAWNKATNPWDEPRTTQEISGLAAGTYNVTVTDSYGCIGTNAVTIDPRPVPNINVSTTADAVCLSSSTREFSILNNHDVDIASHSWRVAPTTGAGMPSNLTTESLEVSPTGISPYEEPVTYVYTDVITAENGCVVSGTVSLTVNPTAILTHTSGDQSQTLCFDEALTDIVYTYSGGADGATLTWTETTPESTCLSWSVDPSAKTLTITEGTTPVAGTYRYTVQTTGAISPCDNPPLSGEIIIRPQLTVEITGVHQSCVTGNIGTATATPAGGNPGSSPAYTYEWNTSATSATISGLTGGDYSVVVTDGAGCTATSSVTIVEKVNPTITVTHENVSCNGAGDGKITVVVTTPGADNPTPYSDGPASQPYYYVFSSDNGATLYDSRGEEQYAQYIFTNLAADAHPVNSHTYNIYVRDGNDCTATEEVNITQPVTLTATIDTDNDVTNSCTGQAVGEATVVAHDGTGPYTYTWNTDPVQSLATATGLAIGTYTVTVEDDHHCIATAQVSIDNRPVPSITAETNTVVCESELPLTLTVVNAGNEVDIASYSWTVDPTENAGITGGTNGATLNVRPTNYTTHRYTQHIVAENGCEVEGYVDLLVNPNPTVALGDVTQPVCPSAGSIEIGATLSYTNSIATPAPPYTYTWTNDGSFAVSSTTPSTSSAITATSVTATVSVPAPNGTDVTCSENYTLRLMVTDSKNCSSTVAARPVLVEDLTPPVWNDDSHSWAELVPDILNQDACFKDADTTGLKDDNEIAALYSDNCGQPVNVEHRDVADASSNACAWTWTRTYTITDACGNPVSPEPSMSISGGDQSAPEWNGSDAWAEVIQSTTGQDACLAERDISGFYSNDYVKGLFTDCSRITVTSNTVDDPDEVTGDDCGWTVTRTYTIVDSCNNVYYLPGTTNKPTMSISGSDQTAPEWNRTQTWAELVQNITGQNRCFADADTTGLLDDDEIAAFYTDHCGQPVTVTHGENGNGEDVAVLNSNSNPDCGWTWTRTYNITDACNNPVTPAPTMSVSGSDQTKPTIQTSTPIRVDAEPIGACHYVVPDLSGLFDADNVDDNCTDDDYLLSHITQDPDAGTRISVTTEVSVIVTDKCGLVSEPISVWVDFHSDVRLETNHDEICKGNSAVLTAHSAGGSTTYSYVWTNVNTGETIRETTDTNEETDQMTVSPTETTRYTVEITNDNGCIMGDGVNVTVKPLPVITFPNDLGNVCPNVGTQEIVANIEATTPGYTYEWTCSELTFDASTTGTQDETTFTIGAVVPNDATAANYCDRSYTIVLHVTDNDALHCEYEAPYTFVVKDEDFPQITCPADIPVNTDLHASTAYVTVPEPEITENCAGYYYTNTFNSAVSESASDTYPLGTTIVTYTVFDICGNRQRASVHRVRPGPGRPDGSGTRLRRDRG